MAQRADDGGKGVEPSPGAIRKQMARTRAELGDKLEMLKTHVLGDVVRQHHGDTMAAKKSTKSAKATGGSKTRSGKASARTSAKKTAGKKAAGAKSAAAPRASRSATKKKPARRRRSSPLVKKAKQVMGEVLAGAAAGAVAGALEAAIPMEQHEAAKLHGHEAQSD